MKFRILYTIGFVTVCVLMSISIYLQLYSGFNPCPLCSLQRVAFVVLGIGFLIGIFIATTQRGARLSVDLFCSLSALMGILLAGRQVWLQQYPPADAAECGVSLQYMLQALPFGEAMKKVFSGSAECTQAGWEFLHLNMAEWSLIWFIILLLLSICCALEELRWKPR